MYKTKESITRNMRVSVKVTEFECRTVRRASNIVSNDSSFVVKHFGGHTPLLEYTPIIDFYNRRSSLNTIGQSKVSYNYGVYSPILIPTIIQNNSVQIPGASFSMDKRNVLMQSLNPHKAKLMESQSTMEPQDFLDLTHKVLESLPELKESPSERKGLLNSVNPTLRQPEQKDVSQEFLLNDLTECLSSMLAKLETKVIHSPRYSIDSQHNDSLKAIDSKEERVLYKAKSPNNFRLLAIGYSLEYNETPASHYGSCMREFLNQDTADNRIPNLRIECDSISLSPSAKPSKSSINSSPEHKFPLLSTPKVRNFTTVSDIRRHYNSDNFLTSKIPALAITTSNISKPINTVNRQMDDDFSSDRHIKHECSDSSQMPRGLAKVCGVQMFDDVGLGRCRSVAVVADVEIVERKVASEQLNRSPVKINGRFACCERALGIFSEGMVSPSEGGRPMSIVSGAKSKNNFGLFTDILKAYYGNMSTYIRSKLLDHGSDLDRRRELNQKRAELIATGMLDADNCIYELDEVIKLHDRQNLINTVILGFMVLLIAILIFRN